MHKHYAQLSVFAFGLISGIIVVMCAADPVARANIAQQAILQQYLLVYCQHSKPGLNDTDKIFVSGEAAAMSRTTIAAGLGALALAAYGECRMKALGG